MFCCLYFKSNYTKKLWVTLIPVDALGSFNYQKHFQELCAKSQYCKNGLQLKLLDNMRNEDDAKLLPLFVNFVQMQTFRLFFLNVIVRMLQTVFVTRLLKVLFCNFLIKSFDLHRRSSLQTKQNISYNKTQPHCNFVQKPITLKSHL